MCVLNNRFLRFWCYQLKTYDCDPALYVMRYLFHRFEFNVEQRYWLCWLYANTYHLPTAWVMWNEFPDFENVDLDRLYLWERGNKQRLPYQKDQKWLRGRLAENFAAYQAEVTSVGSQAAYWQAYRNDFDSAWSKLLSQRFPRFGRYTAWFYLQALNVCCGHNFQPEHMFLAADSSKQPRTGLMLASGLQEADIASMNKFALELVQAAVLLTTGENLPVQPDLFSLETSLCAWSKMPRGAPKGRYLGYYLDRMADDIRSTAKHQWSGIHWGALWEARVEVLFPGLREHERTVVKSEMDVFPTTGAFTPNAQLLHSLDKWYEKQFDSLCL